MNRALLTLVLLSAACSESDSVDAVASPEEGASVAHRFEYDGQSLTVTGTGEFAEWDITTNWTYADGADTYTLDLSFTTEAADLYAQTGETFTPAEFFALMDPAFVDHVLASIEAQGEEADPDAVVLGQVISSMMTQYGPEAADGATAPPAGAICICIGSTKDSSCICVIWY